MKRWSVCLLALVLVVVAFSTRPRSADQTLIAAGTSWKYRDLGTNLGTSWRATSYNDAAWPAGLAPLGYGDGDEATVLSYGPSASSKYVTSYFRRSFTVVNPAALAALTMRFVRDDGCVIYLNGTEVVRSNMPSGTISYTTLATAAIGGADESAWIDAQIDPSLLVAGTNVIAVEVHQQARSSTDISFDLELKAVDTQPAAPVVTLTAPSDHGLTNSTSATFTASATAPAGLTSATLFVGGPPQTVAFTGPDQILDAQISADTATTPNGTGESMTIDGQGPHAHGLMKFPALIGAGAGQVPAGSVIASATLQLNCVNAGNVLGLYRLTEDWAEDQATWNERAPGVPWSVAGADGAASNAGVALGGSCPAIGTISVNVTQFVQEWSNGASNFGFVMIDSGTDGVDFTTSESQVTPVLTVVYKTNKTALGTQPLSGTTAPVSFAATLPAGQIYFWNVQVTDAAGQQSWAPADFQLSVSLGAPDEPVLVSPANGATGVGMPTSLAALVGNPGGGTLSATVELRSAVAPEFTIIAMPDTQHYSEAFPAIFTSQTQWIVDNKTARNIVFVTHEGDIVEHYNLTSEYQAANTSLTKLDGVVPYGLLPGNHDQPTSLYNQFFPYTRYQAQPWYGGHFQTTNDYNFQLFSGGGTDFVIVHMAFCPTAASVTWADSVFKTYPNRVGIMTTHGYLNESAQRTVGGCTNTQYLWDGLAVPNPNLWFMLSGHVHDESRRTDVVNGHPVFQLMADYQDRPSGGEGWLRIMRFVPSDNKVYVQTYSPWLNQFETDANSEFTLDFPMGGAFAAAGTVSAESGSTASVTPAGLLPDTQYEWRMTVTNGGGQSRVGPVWTFRTAAAAANAAPTVATAAAANPNPTAATTASLSVIGADDAGEPGLTYTWATTGAPPAAVTFSANGTNAAKNTVATFTKAGTYTFQVTLKDAGNLTATSSVAVTVTQTLTTIGVTPLNASVPSGGTQVFTPASKDQFGTLMAVAPAIGWTVAGGGTVNASGVFTAGSTAGGPFTITAANGAVSGAALVTVTAVNVPPTVATAAAANPNPAAATTTSLSALGADDAGEPGLTYTWATIGTPPAAVTFNTNGTNAAKNAVATFTKTGSYTFQVTVKDAGNLTTTSNVAVTVSQTLTTIGVTPLNASVAAGGTQAFAATATDQFGAAMTPPPSFAWAVTGGGTISASGLFTAGAAAGGPFSVTASSGTKTGTASVSVTVLSSVVGYVQGATITNDANSGSVAKAFTTANVAGDLIVVAVSWGSNASVSCSDTKGNAYVVATTQYDSTNNQSLAICYAANAKAGTNTVTATFSGAAPYRRMLIHEYKGLALASPVDAVAKNLANGTTAANAITSTAAVTTASGDLVFGAVMMDDPGVTTITAGAGFTQRQSVNNKDLASEDQVQATAGSIAATQTFGAARRYLAQMVAFKKG